MANYTYLFLFTKLLKKERIEFLFCINFVVSRYKFVVTCYTFRNIYDSLLSKKLFYSLLLQCSQMGYLFTLVKL